MKTRRKFVKLSKIQIPLEFLATKPKAEKVIEKTAKLFIEGDYDTIHVDKNMELFDGYITYLILTQLGYEHAEVMICQE